MNIFQRPRSYFGILSLSLVLIGWSILGSSRLAAVEFRLEGGLGLPGHGYHNMSEPSLEAETGNTVSGHLDRSYYPGAVFGFAFAFPLQEGSYFDLIGDYHF
ncbi:MAG: hypothetical protein ORO03_09825, partial [Alphaproteobacteria bacterium]|nr:hypothetical protein [Alphaproteobacteria bacterium]